MTSVVLSTVIQRFNKTGSQGIRAGIGRKLVPNDIVKEFASAESDDTKTCTSPNTLTVCR